MHTQTDLEHLSTYYSGSETRSRAFITSSSRDSGMKPLSEKNKGGGGKRVVHLDVPWPYWKCTNSRWQVHTSGNIAKSTHTKPTACPFYLTYIPQLWWLFYLQKKALNAHMCVGQEENACVQTFAISPLKRWYGNLCVLCLDTYKRK